VPWASAGVRLIDIRKEIIRVNIVFKRLSAARLWRVGLGIYLALVLTAACVKVAKACTAGYMNSIGASENLCSCDYSDQECLQDYMFCQTEVCFPVTGSGCTTFGGDALCIYPEECCNYYTECYYDGSCT
jgi:hypothetical protein